MSLIKVSDYSEMSLTSEDIFENVSYKWDTFKTFINQKAQNIFDTISSYFTRDDSLTGNKIEQMFILKDVEINFNQNRNSYTNEPIINLKSWKTIYSNVYIMDMKKNI